MAECTFCKTKTELYDGGVPVCVECADARENKRKPATSKPGIKETLVSEIVEATARVSAANGEFSEIMNQFPSGLPHPDGVQRIKNASRTLDVARKEMMEAHKRLNDFIERGIVPEDLSRS
jgi:hypothetical protein